MSDKIDLKTKSTCRTCGKEITYTTVKTPGFLPRTGWSDGHRSDPLICFSARNLTHAPIEEDKEVQP